MIVGLLWVLTSKSVLSAAWSPIRESRWFLNLDTLYYRDVLEPPVSNADVTYWLNYHGTKKRRTRKLATINTAVEATTLNSRTFRLRPQDEFIRDNIQADDVLIVSIGGNDIALAPAPCTILSLLCLPHFCLEYSTVMGSIPVSFS
jgi:hypothetical protein